MIPKGQKSHDVKIRDSLGQLYPDMSRLASYVAWKKGFPEHAAEDGLQDAIVLFLQREDEQWQSDFLKASLGEQLGYFWRAICNNTLKAILRNRLEPIPEQGCEDHAAPNLVGEVAEQDAFMKALQQLPEEKREVMELNAQGYTGKEIAIKLNITAEAARKRLFDARKCMREFLQMQRSRP